MKRLLLLLSLVCLALAEKTTTEPPPYNPEKSKCVSMIAAIICTGILVGIVIGILKAKDAIGI